MTAKTLPTKVVAATIEEGPEVIKSPKLDAIKRVMKKHYPELTDHVISLDGSRRCIIKCVYRPGGKILEYHTVKITHDTIDYSTQNTGELSRHPRAIKFQLAIDFYKLFHKELDAISPI